MSREGDEVEAEMLLKWHLLSQIDFSFFSSCKVSSVSDVSSVNSISISLYHDFLLNPFANINGIPYNDLCVVPSVIF